MPWLLIAQLLALTYVSCHPAAVVDRGLLRAAWCWLAAVPVSQFAMALFRAGNFRDARDMVLIEIWSNGFLWLFAGLSLFCLGMAFRSKER